MTPTVLPHARSPLQIAERTLTPECFPQTALRTPPPPPPPPALPFAHL